MTRIEEDKKVDHHDQSSKPVEPKRVYADDLFGEEKEILIEHQKENYRLRITSNGKLILTK